MNEETIVISLGGSLIIPDQIDVDFLKEFKKLILSQVEKGKKFVIITGGGKLCRRYQDAAKEVSSSSNNEDLDWIGIAALKLNAELLRVVFGDYANKEVINSFEDKLIFEKPIFVGSAYKPGQSTDWGATLAAKNIGAKTVINLSNTDYVYDSDPKKNPNAKKIEKINWSEYRKIIPAEWNPGLNTPFDPIASKEAEEAGIEVVIMNGKPISNLADYLEKGEIKGTLIK